MRRRRLRPSHTGRVHVRWAAPCEIEAGFDARSLQLCAQVRRALEFAFAECRDAALCDLLVIDVVPDPTVRRLRVWLRGPARMDAEDRERLLERLAAARGFLRAQVAGAIHRKRTPELVFELLGGVDEREAAAAPGDGDAGEGREGRAR